jgi:hypothetical protein
VVVALAEVELEVLALAELPLLAALELAFLGDLDDEVVGLGGDGLSGAAERRGVDRSGGAERGDSDGGGSGDREDASVHVRSPSVFVKGDHRPSTFPKVHQAAPRRCAFRHTALRKQKGLPAVRLAARAAGRRRPGSRG